jgi:hypothetical protein
VNENIESLTHTLHGVWNLRERGLLGHLLLHGEQHRFVYHGLHGTYVNLRVTINK